MILWLLDGLAIREHGSGGIKGLTHFVKCNFSLPTKSLLHYLVYLSDHFCVSDLLSQCRTRECWMLPMWVWVIIQMWWWHAMHSLLWIWSMVHTMTLQYQAHLLIIDFLCSNIFGHNCDSGCRCSSTKSKNQSVIERSSEYIQDISLFTLFMQILVSFQFFQHRPWIEVCDYKFIHRSEVYLAWLCSFASNLFAIANKNGNGKMTFSKWRDSLVCSTSEDETDAMLATSWAKYDTKNVRYLTKDEATVMDPVNYCKYN